MTASWEVTEQYDLTDRGNEFVWINPESIEVNPNELHWKKISPDVVRLTLRTLEQLRPYLKNSKIPTERESWVWRERLATLTDSTGKAIFNEQDLRVFDLYFGADHIRVEKIGDRFSVTNGRHRLWMAQQERVQALPVFITLAKAVGASKAGKEIAAVTESNELRELEADAEKQQEQAEEMKFEVEQHQNEVKKLVQAIEEIRASARNVSSERLREAQSAAEKAKSDTEQRLDEKKRERDKMLEENQRLTEKIHQAKATRQRALEKARLIPNPEHAKPIFDALQLDIANLGAMELRYREARKLLTEIDV
jgi:hypothetical protein